MPLIDGMGFLALAGGTVLRSPNAAPLRDAALLIRDGTIVSVAARSSATLPDRCETLDCTGALIVAGFWNSHVHFFERKWVDAERIPRDELGKQLQPYAQFGFTTVFDLSSSLANTSVIRRRIDSDEVPGPSILTTGEGLIAPGAMPPEAVLRVMGAAPVPLPEMRDAAHAADVARGHLEAGADGLKVFASAQNGERIAAGVMEAVARAARAYERPSFVHPNTADDVRRALRAGIDVIAHTTPRFAWDDDLLALAGAQSAALTPTLTLWDFFLRHDRISVQDRARAAAVEQLSRWIAARGTVLFGTDAGAVDIDPAREYALMQNAGMDFASILASLTTAPAARFGKGRSGTIAAGNDADLVILDGGAEVQSLTRVRSTIRRGRIVYSRPDAAEGTSFSTCNQR